MLLPAITHKIGYDTGGNMKRWRAIVATLCLFVASAAGAEERVTQASASFLFNGQRIEIGRDSRDAARFVAAFASAGDACGAPCIAPLQVAPGIRTVDEIGVLDFLTRDVADNTGLMVDARLPEDRAKGFIPGTVSLPFATLNPDNDFRDDILRALGARELDGIFNFADARALLVYDLGPSSNDAGSLIANLLTAGYPADLIRYYRGGMQVWSVLGFSIEEGQT